MQKLERTGIDPTSDGSGIDNWTLRNALLSWSALKISTVRPSRGGVVPTEASVECLKRSLLTWFTSVLASRHAAFFSQRKFHTGVDLLNMIDN